MGGSFLDSACRSACTLIALTAFCYLAFYQADEYRKENGLTDCYTGDNVEQPLYPLTAESGLIFNVSAHWQWLFYAHIGAAVYTIIQIIVATVAY